jgi:DNA-binding transcriptional MerR regulator
MDISEVARKSGVAASALRYYERKGLIHSLGEGSRQVRAGSWTSWR